MKKQLFCSYIASGKPVLVVLFLIMAWMPLSRAKMTASDRPAYFLDDSVKYTSYIGRVLEKDTKKPVVFANVQIFGTNIGTVTNSDGDFLIKIPDTGDEKQLIINHLGFKKSVVDVKDLSQKRNIIYLEIASIPIQEITIRTDDPLDLLYAAMKQRSSNYSMDPVMLTSFYRETIQQNKNYVAVAEAVIDIYKAPYLSPADKDRSKIFKGRKSQDVKKMDTIYFKLQGGPYSALMLDVVKNPGEILSYDFFEFYDYELNGISYIQDRLAYVISFKQKRNVTAPLYQGKIYLDADNLAFTGLDFQLTHDDPAEAAQLLVRKKPSNMKIDVEEANYLTKYREIDGIWYLAYVRSEVVFTCKWDKKLFKSTYTAMTEMAVTDIDKENLNRFKMKESSRYSDVLTEQVTQFEDPDYWGEYNIIKPDENIEAAIDKLNRKLKKQL
ncbi:MAG: carboxypeptidase-like regulatory domain-containing protein [Bacteroidales bacterium]|nr:carboxypeptidase-like regulatory domain-containing protein [Bacteroidales bacterium]